MSSPRPRVLLVDDEAEIRRLLVEWMEAMGWAVQEAPDGETALREAQRGGFDLAVVDIRLPGMDGVEVLRRLRGMDACLPVVMITGFPEVEVAVRAMREGAYDYLVKPFSLSSLERVAQQALRERRVLEERGSVRLVHQLVRQLEGLSLLHRLEETLQGARSREEVFQRVVETACRMVRAERALLVLVERERGELVVGASHGPRAPAPGALLEEGAVRRAIRDGRPRLLPGRPSGGEPLACVPLRIRGQALGALVTLRPRGRVSFAPEDLQALEALVGQAALQVENVLLYESVYQNLTEALRALVRGLEARDPYTFRHSEKVTELATAIAQRLGLPPDRVEVLRIAGYLHDIGKIGVSDAILLKPGRLTPQEFEVIKRHPVIGEQIVGSLSFLEEERGVIRHHHERWDGRGYPDGLRGERIPLLARILSVADAFDAMTSDRPYRRAMTVEQALEEIRRCRGTQFDPEAARALEEVIEAAGPPAPEDRAAP